MNVVSDRFHELANNSVRPLDWEVGISWNKERNSEISWFQLDVSQLDGGDLLAENNENPIQLWDAYDYARSRDRVIEMNVERSVEFPYNIQSAIADVKLNNYDGYYTYHNSASPISQDILPSRPIRLYLGFQEAGLTPVFVGLTETIPKYSGNNNEVAEVTAIDFLAQIGDMSLKNMVMMRDARTDEVISAILEQFGMRPEMYHLAEGVNTIPFVYFESGKDAGNALHELIQAENGYMWIDEQGVVRFETRSSVAMPMAMVFNQKNIVSIRPKGEDTVINKVTIEADIRTVRERQPIFTSDNSNGYSSSASEDSYRIPANGSKTIWINLEDPAFSASDLVFNGSADDSSFTAVDLSGNAVSSGLSATGEELFAESYKVTINNTNAFPVSVNFIQLWGEPAKVIGESPSVKYSAYDEDSVEAFGVRELKITDNKCFGSYENIDSYAMDILSKYKNYNSVIEAEVKGDPSLQLWDGVVIEDGDFSGTWRVVGIKHKLANSKLTTELTLLFVSLATSLFVLDVSQLNGEDVLA